MTRRKKPVDDLDEELDNELEEGAETLDAADPVEAVDPVPVVLVDPTAVAVTDKEQEEKDKVQAITAAQTKVEVAKSEVEELEAKLEAAKANLSQSEQNAAEVEENPLQGNQPCCLPQHDPTLRSARTTQQAQQMTQVLKNNNPQ